MAGALFVDDLNRHARNHKTNPARSVAEQLHRRALSLGLDCADACAALTLLRALLARRPQDRPPHALAISRLAVAAQGSALRRAA